jgi:predicted metal-dependent hydrolase
LPKIVIPVNCQHVDLQISMVKGTMNQMHEIEFDGARMAFRLRRSNRQTLAITVQPDLSVVVTVPQKASLETVRAKLRKRARWIRRQQRYFSEFLPPTPPRRYVSGETHRYLGRQYRLKVVQGPTREAKLKGRFIWVQTPRNQDRAEVQKLVDGWFLMRAKERLARSFAESIARLGVRLTRPPRMHVRRMAKRWGSWTRRSGVWLNPELVKAPASCIDYVVTHEICHAMHGNHGKQFYELLRCVMPDWEDRKARLERLAT